MEESDKIGDENYKHLDEMMDIFIPEMENLVSWPDLPSIALQQIYSYISMPDKTNMSLVCKQWSQEFGAPCNWRHIQFQFPERYSPLKLQTVVKFAERYAHLFHHVEIICGRVCTGLLEQTTNQLRQFCDLIAQSSRIKSLYVENLKAFFRWTDGYLRSEVVSSLKNLLRSQKFLEKLEFVFSNFSKEEAVDILRSICEYNTSLKEIRFKRFIYETRTPRNLWSDNDSDEEENNANTNPAAWISGCMKSLKIWSGDYNSIFEDVILNLPTLLGGNSWDKGYPRCLGAFENIYLTCDSWTTDICQGITPEAWKECRLIFPRLRIDLTIFSSTTPRSLLEFVVVKNIPLQNLHYSIISGPRSQFLTTENFFHFLVNCGVDATLEELHLLWEIGGSEGIMTELIDFTRRCQCLRTMVIQMSWPFIFQENLFVSWIENRPKALETIFLTVTHIPRHELNDQLLSNAQSYTPIIQELGITFALILEPARSL